MYVLIELWWADSFYSSSFYLSIQSIGFLKLKMEISFMREFINVECNASVTSVVGVDPLLRSFLLSSQLLNSQKEMQKQMSNLVAVPVSKECKRLEASLGRNMEKAIKANTDALWARFQEENAKSEKLLRNRIQQTTTLLTNFSNKDLPAMLEKAVKKELGSIGSTLVCTLSPVIEKMITTAITESFQVSFF